ncbi:hypothetical protein [Mesorhizobium sp. IMUNJ 23232]|uniref:hypothetical protein n=1 Tax=Mesorhizobium sp. IMUNJ 23232 TaxID=3376064 RepID=UPI0037AC7605
MKAPQPSTLFMYSRMQRGDIAARGDRVAKLPPRLRQGAIDNHVANYRAALVEDGFKGEELDRAMTTIRRILDAALGEALDMARAERSPALLALARRKGVRTPT